MKNLLEKIKQLWKSLMSKFHKTVEALPEPTQPPVVEQLTELSAIKPKRTRTRKNAVGHFEEQ